jgi:WD40 repeat protein
VTIWDLEHQPDAPGGDCLRELVELPAHQSYVSSVAFSPDSRLLATGSLDQTVTLWDLKDGKKAAPQLLHTLRQASPINSVAFNTQGSWLAVGSDDHRVTVWDVASGRVVRKLQGHAAPVHSVAFSPDGWRLATSSADHTVKVWDATTSPEADFLVGHASLVYQVVFGKSGGLLASASSDRTMRIWDRSTGEVLRVLCGHAKEVFGLAFSPDGRRLASAGGDRTVRLWEVATGRPVAVLKGHTGVVSKVAFSPDGHQVASASADETVRLWDVTDADDGVERPMPTARILQGHRGQVWNVAFSPDGRRLASAGDDGTVRVWERESGQEKLTLRGHGDAVRSVVFSPDGLTLASTGDDQTVRVWDLATGRQKWLLQGNTAQLRDVAFSPDGRRLAAAGADQVKIWDAVTGQEVFLLRAPQGQLFSVAFSSDGLQLAAAGQAHLGSPGVVIWDGTALTPEAREQREAQSLVRLLLASLPGRDDVLARLRQDVTLREPLRNRALALVEPCERARLRKEAERVVRALFNDALLRPEVLQHLRDDATCNPAVRQEALALAEQYVECAHFLNIASRTVARPADAGPVDYPRALRQAEAACALTGYDGGYQTTRGMVLYRMARYPDAVDALIEADRLLGTENAQPATVAFLAMAQHQRGQKELAQAARQRFQSLMQQPSWAQDKDATALLQEVEALLAQQPGRRP